MLTSFGYLMVNVSLLPTIYNLSHRLRANMKRVWIYWYERTLAPVLFFEGMNSLDG